MILSDIIILSENITLYICLCDLSFPRHLQTCIRHLSLGSSYPLGLLGCQTMSSLPKPHFP